MIAITSILMVWLHCLIATGGCIVMLHVQYQISRSTAIVRGLTIMAVATIVAYGHISFPWEGVDRKVRIHPWCRRTALAGQCVPLPPKLLASTYHPLRHIDGLATIVIIMLVIAEAVVAAVAVPVVRGIVIGMTSSWTIVIKARGTLELRTHRRSSPACIVHETPAHHTEDTRLLQLEGANWALQVMIISNSQD
jgi:hypothetical protein